MGDQSIGAVWVTFHTKLYETSSCSLSSVIWFATDRIVLADSDSFPLSFVFLPQPGETVLVQSRSWFNDRPELVPEGHVWLEGDNPSNSSDSRTYGPIPLAMIRGRVFFKVRIEEDPGSTVSSADVRRLRWGWSRY